VSTHEFGAIRTVCQTSDDWPSSDESEIPLQSLRDEKRPLYARASEVVEEFIAEAKLDPGDKLPAEAELARILGVSRSTIREGLRELELRARVERIHGRGTLVAKPRMVAGLTVLASLESLARAQGWACGTRDIEFGTAEPPEVAAAALQVGSAATTTLSRVKTKDGAPIARMISWLPTTVISADDLERDFDTSITEFLLGLSTARLHYARASVTAAPAGDDEAKALAVPPAAPLIVLLETFFDRSERPICYSRNVFVPDAVELEVIRDPA
jgi:GntR family transcriptional regulator